MLSLNWVHALQEPQTPPDRSKRRLLREWPLWKGPEAMNCNPFGRVRRLTSKRPVQFPCAGFLVQPGPNHLRIRSAPMNGPKSTASRIQIIWMSSEFIAEAPATCEEIQERRQALVV